MTKVLVGLDIAKDKIDIALSSAEGPRALGEVANTPAGFHKLLARLPDPASLHVVLEATGNYHLHLVKHLQQAGVSLSVINPVRSHSFSKMQMLRTKTDRGDAKLLVRYGQQQKPPAHRPVSPPQQHLKQINTTLELFTKQLTMLHNQYHAQALVPEGSREVLGVLEQAMQDVKQRIKQLIEEQARLIEVHFKSTHELISSVKGVGTKTALALLAYVGKLDTFTSAKQLCAYMGLNPMLQESGTMQKKAHISKQGNARLRRLFYLCALSARRYNSSCRALYRRLKARGKSEKMALIAVANKLVRQVFAVVKSGVPFDDDYIKKIAMTP